jgi:REP element-mobilizing transposase RayT
MAGIIEMKRQKSIIVNGVEDHVQIFVGLRPSMAISDLVRDIRNNSSKFINSNGFLGSQFQWQEGFGSFSYSHSHVKSVYDYVLNQDEHHRKTTFKDEYVDLLKRYETTFDLKYVFD